MDIHVARRTEHSQIATFTLRAWSRFSLVTAQVKSLRTQQLTAFISVFDNTRQQFTGVPLNILLGARLAAFVVLKQMSDRALLFWL